MPASDRPQGVSPACSTDHLADIMVKKMEYGQISRNGTNIDIGHLAGTLYLPWQTSNVARMDTFGWYMEPVLSCTFDSEDPLRPTKGRSGGSGGEVQKGSFFMEISGK